MFKSHNKIIFGSIEAARDVLENGYASLVWPDEGEFRGKDFVFNAEHEDFDAITLDSFTSSAIVKVYEALNADNQKAVEKMLKQNRVRFMKFIDFCWKQCK